MDGRRHFFFALGDPSAPWCAEANSVNSLPRPCKWMALCHQCPVKSGRKLVYSMPRIRLGKALNGAGEGPAVPAVQLVSAMSWARAATNSPNQGP